jgi:hypothetical protein
MWKIHKRYLPRSKCIEFQVDSMKFDFSWNQHHCVAEIIDFQKKLNDWKLHSIVEFKMASLLLFSILTISRNLFDCFIFELSTLIKLSLIEWKKFFRGIDKFVIIDSNIWRIKQLNWMHSYMTKCAIWSFGFWFWIWINFIFTVFKLRIMNH